MESTSQNTVAPLLSSNSSLKLKNYLKEMAQMRYIPISFTPLFTCRNGENDNNNSEKKMRFEPFFSSASALKLIKSVYT